MRAPPAASVPPPESSRGVAHIKELTDGLGAHSVIEAVGTKESMMQAIRATRPGGSVGYVGLSHGVELPWGTNQLAPSRRRADPAGHRGRRPGRHPPRSGRAGPCRRRGGLPPDEEHWHGATADTFIEPPGHA